MRVDGRWLLCDNGVERPIVRGELQARDGSWRMVEFLLDTGADRTVLSADVLQKLALPSVKSAQRLSGLGGEALSVLIETNMHLLRDSGSPIAVSSRFAGVTDPAALDMCVLGRDITDLFSVIVDRPGDVVCLLSQRHRYAIVKD